MDIFGFVVWLLASLNCNPTAGELDWSMDHKLQNTTFYKFFIRITGKFEVFDGEPVSHHKNSYTV